MLREEFKLPHNLRYGGMSKRGQKRALTQVNLLPGTARNLLCRLALHLT
jgi:hypothetical protein